MDDLDRQEKIRIILWRGSTLSIFIRFSIPRAILQFTGSIRHFRIAIHYFAHFIRFPRENPHSITIRAYIFIEQLPAKIDRGLLLPAFYCRQALHLIGHL